MFVNSSTKCLYFHNSAKGTSYFFSMATLNAFILLTATSTLTVTKTEGIVAFPWQQLLRERPTI